MNRLTCPHRLTAVLGAGTAPKCPCLVRTVQSSRPGTGPVAPSTCASWAATQRAGRRAGDFTARHRLLYRQPPAHLSSHLLRRTDSADEAPPRTPAGRPDRHPHAARRRPVAPQPLEISRQAVEIGARYDHLERYSSQFSPRLSAVLAVRPELTTLSAVGRPSRLPPSRTCSGPPRLSLNR